MDLIQELTKYYTAFIRQKKNNELSAHTVRHYTSALNAFFKYLTELDRLKIGKLKYSDIDENLFFDFLDWLEKNHSLKNSTKKSYLIRLKIFFKFVEKKSSGQIELRKSIEDINIKLPQFERKSLSVDEKKRLLSFFSYFESHNDIKIAQRILFAKLLFFSGIRAIELRRLRFVDFILTDGIYEFKVYGKGNKERYCYVSENILSYEINLLSASKNYVCETRTGKPMCHSQLWKTTKEIFTEARISETGVHIFRHTFAKYLVQKGVNLSVIKDLLGHSDIKVTQIYTKSDEVGKRQAIIAAFDSLR